jgi:hypothetical protein
MEETALWGVSVLKKWMGKESILSELPLQQNCHVVYVVTKESQWSIGTQ